MKLTHSWNGPYSAKCTICGAIRELRSNSRGQRRTSYVAPDGSMHTRAPECHAAQVVKVMES